MQLYIYISLYLCPIRTNTCTTRDLLTLDIENVFIFLFFYLLFGKKNKNKINIDVKNEWMRHVKKLK